MLTICFPIEDIIMVINLVQNAFKKFLNNKELNYGKPDKDIILDLICNIVYNGENKSIFTLNKSPNVNMYQATHTLDDNNAFIIVLYIANKTQKFKLILHHLEYRCNINRHIHRLAYCIEDSINNKKIDDQLLDLYTYMVDICKPYSGANLNGFNNIVYT